MALTKGWFYMDYGTGNYQVPIKDWKVDKKDKGFFSDFSSDGHFGFSTRTYKRMLKIKGLMFDNKTDYDLFLSALDTLQAAGAFDCRIKVKSDNTWYKFNGVNYTMPVLFVDSKGEGKSAFGDDQHYEIQMLMLRQAGALKDT